MKISRAAGSQGTSEKYYVYGKITAIESHMYGSMTITDETGSIYSIFLGLVYFMPLFGGIAADKFGYGKMVTIGTLPTSQAL